jgi:hypothetical protein
MSDAPEDDLRSLDERLDHLTGFTEDESRAGWTPPIRRVTAPPPAEPGASVIGADVGPQLAALVAAVDALTARVDDLTHAEPVADHEVDDLITDLRRGRIGRTDADDPSTVGREGVATMAALQDLRTEMREALLEIAATWQGWRETSGASVRELSDTMAELLERQSASDTDPPRPA